jgi:hypothetical protein
LSSCL